MRKVDTVGLVGGDLRSVFAAGRLAAAGYTVLACGLERAELPAGVTACPSPEQAIPMMDAVLLPVPVSADEETVHAPLACSSLSLQRLLELLSPAQRLFGGGVSEQLAQQAAQRGLHIEDCYRQQELAEYNAVPAAEGAIQLAMEELPVTIDGSRALVTGCGRVGKALARRLALLGAKVTVAARRPEARAWARCNGCKAVPIEEMTAAGDFDVIFNTVPAPLFTAPLLRQIGGALLIDIASKPGGVDWDAAAALRCRTIWALSLPGRVAPQTAGEILAEAVLRRIAE